MQFAFFPCNSCDAALQVLGGTMHEMVWKGEEGDSDDEYSRSTGRSLAGEDDDDDSDSDGSDSDDDSGDEVGTGTAAATLGVACILQVPFARFARLMRRK